MLPRLLQTVCGSTGIYLAHNLVCYIACIFLSWSLVVCITIIYLRVCHLQQSFLIICFVISILCHIVLLQQLVVIFFIQLVWPYTILFCIMCSFRFEQCLVLYCVFAWSLSCTLVQFYTINHCLPVIYVYCLPALRQFLDVYHTPPGMVYIWGLHESLLMIRMYQHPTGYLVHTDTRRLGTG